MTEGTFIKKNCDLIMELVAECQKLTSEEYVKFKAEFMSGLPEMSKPFARKIFLVIDNMRRSKEHE